MSIPTQVQRGITLGLIAFTVFGAGNLISGTFYKLNRPAPVPSVVVEAAEQKPTAEQKVNHLETLMMKRFRNLAL